VAKKIEAKIKTQLIEGKWLDRLPGQEKTFKEMMERYMTEHSQPRKKSWRRDKISLLHLLPFFKGHFLRDITSESISQYKAQRYQEGAKPSTLNRELSLMKHAFDLALKEWNWIRENPMSKVKMERENNERDRVLSYEDEERLLAASPP
jgi:site-specific recombinase XerD